MELVAQSKLKTKSVTIRLPEKWILRAKVVAAQMDMPYQTFMKQLIRKGLHME
jgi:predicted DNA binding CopG/RHH family protein